MNEFPLDQALAQVQEFMLAGDQNIRETPGQPSLADLKLRIKLHYEEVVEELEAAMLDQDMEGILDGIVDSIYVFLGTALAYGLRRKLSKAWNLVHQANMAKVWPGEEKMRKDRNGKVIKPEGWQPPDIAGLLKEE